MKLNDIFKWYFMIIIGAVEYDQETNYYKKVGQGTLYYKNGNFIQG